MQTPHRGQTNWDLALNGALQDLDVRVATKAEATHTHDGTYSPTTHTHEASYAPVVHTHSGFVPASTVGAPHGPALLDGDGVLAPGQLPNLSGAYLAVAQKGAASGVATLDGSVHVPAAQIPDLSGTYSPAAHTHTDVKRSIYPFSFAGLVAPTTGAWRLYNDTGTAWTVQGIRASVTNAPTGTGLVVDVRVNGITIYATPSNRPAIANGALTSGVNTLFSTSTIAAGAYVTVDIVSVGSTFPGKNLQIALIVV